jgi:hypothetical protein
MIFVTNCFKFLEVLIIWIMACYFPFWCLRLIVMFAFWKNIYKEKCLFSCVLHTANTLTCFERSLYIYIYTHKIFEVLKNVFSHGFLKHTKKISCISGFYNMFVKLQRVLANIPKNLKILFWGENSSIIHR